MKHCLCFLGRSFFFFLIATITIGFFSHVDALVLCARKDKEGDASGAVSIRDTCKKNETQLDPVTLGLVGPQGPKGDQGDKGEPGLPGLAGLDATVLKDANGMRFGIFYPESSSSRGVVLLQDGEGKTAMVSVTRERLYFTQDGRSCVLYTSEDCHGVALLPPSVALVSPGVVIGGILYTHPSVGTMTTVQSLMCILIDQPTCSNRGGVFSPPDTCCSAADPPFEETLGPAITQDVSGFVPPFHVELQP